MKETEEKVKVYIAALNQGWLRYELTQQLMMLSHDERYEKVFAFPTRRPVSDNRNNIVLTTLKTDADFLLMVDADIRFESNPLDYIQCDYDVLAFPAPVYQYRRDPKQPIRWNMLYRDKAGVDYRKEITPGVVRVARIGTGAMLIARRVLEHPDIAAPFAEHFDEQGLLTDSEDFSFCDKARVAGFEIYAATEAPCGHYREVDLLTVWGLTDKSKKGSV